MSGLFGEKPKAVQTPPVPAPPAIPEVGEEVRDIARKTRPRGRAETFLTGELIPTVDVNDNLRKKKVLG